MAGPTFAGPSNSIALGLPGGNQCARNAVSSASAFTVKTLPGVLAGVTCLGAGGIALWDAATNVTTTYTTTAGTVTGTVTAGFLSATNQLYTVSSMSAGQTLGLSVPCVTGIAASVTGAAATFNIGFG